MRYVGGFESWKGANGKSAIHNFRGSVTDALQSRLEQLAESKKKIELSANYAM
jgi:hypothetical protein